jgi:hypothetical protein
MTPEAQPAEKNERVLVLSALVLIGTTFSIGFHYWQRAYLGMKYPYDTFLFYPPDRFGDFFKVLIEAARFNNHVPKTGMQYTPFTHMLATGMGYIPPKAAFALAIGAFLATLVALLFRFAADALPDVWIKIQTVFILVGLSYPVLFLLDRSNLEVLLFPAITGFFYFYYLRPSAPRWAAYACLVLAICLKLYPAVLLVIPISDRRFKEVAYSVAACLAVFALSMGALSLVRHESVAQTVYWATYAVKAGQGQRLLGVHMAHSLFGVLAVVSAPFTPFWGIQWFVRPYLVFVVAAFAAIAAYVLFVEKEPWRKAALLLISALLLPYVSSDYTLVHLYPVIVLFLGAGGLTRRRAMTYTVLFALLLVPMDYFIFFWPRFYSRLTDRMVSEVSTSVLVYPTVMVIIVALIVYDGFRARAAGDR